MKTYLCEREGCGRSFEARRRARFCSAACRSAAWKAQHGYSDPRKAAQASRNGKHGPNRKPDLRISYRKAVELPTPVFEHYANSSSMADELLSSLLTDRQRASQ